MFSRKRRSDAPPATGSGDLPESAIQSGPATKSGFGITEPESGPVTRSWRMFGIAALVALLVAIAATVWASIAMFHAVENQSIGTSRDAALAGADQAMLNVTNIKPGDIEAFKKRAGSTLIGDVTQQLSASGLDTLSKLDPKDGEITSAIARSALSEFNNSEHTGAALVYVTMTAVRPNQASTSQTMGFLVKVAVDAGIWKAKSIQPLDGINTDQSQNSAATTDPSAAPDSNAPDTSAAPDASAAPAPEGGN